MSSIVQTAVSEAILSASNLQMMKGIEYECSALISTMSFLDKPAMRSSSPRKEPIDDINQRFFCGEDTLLIRRYEVRVEKFLTMRPNSRAEAVFIFRRQGKDMPDIIRLRATDHIHDRSSNAMGVWYLIWQIEAFPDPKDYERHPLETLMREISDLALAHGFTQNVLLAIIARIYGNAHLMRT